ncbi:MAG: FAD-binding oxidoreductase [Deltaproteobacteria bacterium]|nr:FAD-binding oxidoreductase [Deltaproteobacteria bacterium]
MNYNQSTCRERLSALFRKDQLIFEGPDLSEVLENSYGIERQITGVVYPQSTKEVQDLVRLASELSLPLYPISRGMNQGYGDRLPVEDGQLIVDLQRMQAIRRYNPDGGIVTLEPGVTQKQLFDFLRSKQAPFWMDATGAGSASSIIGNTLEGGFGHTPLGNRRRQILDLEVVLGDGTLLNTGIFPSCGPNLSGLFVQSNFGIITAMSMSLMPVPSAFASYVIRVGESQQLGRLIEALGKLKQRGLIRSVPHVGNAVRTLMTTMDFATTWNSSEILTNEAAVKILSRPLLKVGPWNALGALYGSRAEVAESRACLRRAVRRMGNIDFFNDLKIGAILGLAAIPGLASVGLVKAVRRNAVALKELHLLMQGVPCNMPTDKIHWRVNRSQDLGLFWVAPTMTPAAEEIERLLSITSPLFKKHGFEMPITISLIEPFRAIGVFSIGFNKNIPAEKERARALYHELWEAVNNNGFEPYRCGVQSMSKIRYAPERAHALELIKAALDPAGIISPGRYGIKK